MSPATSCVQCLRLPLTSNGFRQTRTSTAGDSPGPQAFLLPLQAVTSNLYPHARCAALSGVWLPISRLSAQLAGHELGCLDTRNPHFPCLSAHALPVNGTGRDHMKSGSSQRYIASRPRWGNLSQDAHKTPREEARQAPGAAAAKACAELPPPRPGIRSLQSRSCCRR